MISTLEGQKTIESLKLGDKALSWNPETGKLEYRMITNLFERKTDLIYKLTFSSGHSVETTWNHPFWVSSTGTSTDSTGSPTTGSVSDISSLQAGKWIETKDLKVGDVLKTANSSSLFISAISTDARVETVYNFEVEGNHTYFVGEDGVLVHNQSASYAAIITGALVAPVNPVAGAVAIGMGVCKLQTDCNEGATNIVTQGVDKLKGFISAGIDKVKGLWSKGEDQGKDNETDKEDQATKGKRVKNRLEDKGEPNTTEWNKPKTTAKKYGPDGWVEKEFNKGHAGNNTPKIERGDHVHDWKPNPNNPSGRPTRQEGRNLNESDLKDFGNIP